MKNNIIRLLALLLPVMGLFSSCNSKDDITFENEKQVFETKADKILLEVIVPSTTESTDNIYISGDFNGGDDVAVTSDTWKLTQSTKNTAKWGVYLDPNTFASGKTLSDGYHFVSVQQGLERSVFNTDVNHTDNPGLGHFANVWVSRWAKWFQSEEEPVEHDGYVVYVDNQTTWNALALYAWGDKEAFGGWPGMQPTGTETKNGTTYTYFDMGTDNEGLNLHLIFNNNGGGSQLADYDYTVNKDVYLKITDSGVEEATPSITHDGYVVYVDDQTGWGDDLSLYMYGDVNDLNGSWPGMKITGTEVKDGVTYKYFDMGAANQGLKENLIFSNNGSNQLGDFKNYTIDHDIYLTVTLDGVTEKGAAPVTKTEHKIYVEDKTGWPAIALYAYGADELFGGWPGATPTTETKDAVEYKVFTYSAVDGNDYNLIFNNNGGGTQLADYAIKSGSDLYLTVTAEGVSAKSSAKRSNRRK